MLACREIQSILTRMDRIVSNLREGLAKEKESSRAYTNRSRHTSPRPTNPSPPHSHPPPQSNSCPACRCSLSSPHHRCGPHQCPSCPSHFPCAGSLSLHSRLSHNLSQLLCSRCNQFIPSSSWREHIDYLCGEKKLRCEGCEMEVPQSRLEQHVSVCCYRHCPRCGQEVYAKVYAYHLGGCRGERAERGLRRVKSIEAFAGAKPMVLPCSLVYL